MKKRRAIRTPSGPVKPTGPGDAPRPRRLGAILAGLAAAWLVIVIYDAHVWLPPNPITLPLEQQLKFSIQAALPQGWAFFTLSPREKKFRPFVRADGVWVSAGRGPHAEPRNAFGLNRASRAQGVEIGLLQAAVAPNAWEACDGEIGTCLDRAPIAATLKNPSPSPTLCGAVGLAQQEPVPWAWSATAGSLTMPGTVARLDVRC